MMVPLDSKTINFTVTDMSLHALHVRFQNIRFVERLKASQQDVTNESVGGVGVVTSIFYIQSVV